MTTQREFEPKPQDVLPDVALFAGSIIGETLENEGIRHKAFDRMVEKEGCVVGADTLYAYVFDKDFDPSDSQAQTDRIKIYNLFNGKQSMGKLFLEMVEEQSYVTQVGTLFIGRQDPDKKPKQKRLYRMFKAENYVPARDDQTVFNGKDYIEWEPTPVAHEVVVSAYDNTPPVQALHRATKRKIKPPQTPKKAKIQFDTGTEKDNWLDKWKEKVDQTIQAVDEDGLMREGFIKASIIQFQSGSTIIGTKKLRSRMHAANLLSRSAINITEPLTADEIILMRLFNPNQQLLGQKTPQQKEAVEIVLDKVIEHFDRKQSAQSN